MNHSSWIQAVAGRVVVSECPNYVIILWCEVLYSLNLGNEFDIVDRSIELQEIRMPFSVHSSWQWHGWVALWTGQGDSHCLWLVVFNRFSLIYHCFSIRFILSKNSQDDEPTAIGRGNCEAMSQSWIYSLWLWLFTFYKTTLCRCEANASSGNGSFRAIFSIFGNGQPRKTYYLVCWLVSWLVAC